MTAIAQAVSVALLHFLWQGLLVAFLLSIVLFLLRKRSPAARYSAGCVALAVLGSLPILTAWMVYEPGFGGRSGVEFAGAVVPAVVTASAASPGISWLAGLQVWALPLWSFGVLLFSFRFLWAWSHISTLRREGKPVQDSVLAIVTNLAERMGVTRSVRVLASSIADGPSVVGWIRPVILLPAATLVGLTPAQLEAVVAHELAHIRRYDYLVNVLQMAAETLLFYHPAVWWTSRRIRYERELCCDDIAVHCCGDAMCYARALTKLERLRETRPSFALGSNDGPLLYRIQRLIARDVQECEQSRLAVPVVLSLAFACFALSINLSAGQVQKAQPGAVQSTGAVNEIPAPDRVQGIAKPVIRPMGLAESLPGPPPQDNPPQDKPPQVSLFSTGTATGSGVGRGIGQGLGGGAGSGLGSDSPGTSVSQTPSPAPPNPAEPGLENVEAEIREAVRQAVAESAGAVTNTTINSTIGLVMKRIEDEIRRAAELALPTRQDARRIREEYQRAVEETNRALSSEEVRRAIDDASRLDLEDVRRAVEEVNRALSSEEARRAIDEASRLRSETVERALEQARSAPAELRKASEEIRRALEEVRQKHEEIRKASDEIRRALNELRRGVETRPAAPK